MSETAKAPLDSVPVTLATPVTRAEADRKSIAGTEAAALKALGQRDINLIWEQTQMRVALSVVWTSLAVSMMLGIFGKWLGAPDIQLAL